MYASIFSGIVPLVAILIYRDKIRMQYFVWLGLLSSVSFLTDITSLIALKLRLFQSNTYLVNSYYIALFILLLLFYHDLYLKERKVVIFFLLIFFFGFEIGNSIAFQDLDTFQTYTWVFIGAIFICLSIGYFVHLLKSGATVDIAKSAPGWINLAMLFYFAFSLYLFTLAEYVFTNMHTDAATIFWSFHNINNVVKNSMFAVAVYYGAREFQPGP